MSQAILKRFIDLKFSVWFTLGSQNETVFVTLRTCFSFLFPLSSLPTYLGKIEATVLSRVDCRSFSVLTILTGKVLSVTKHGFVFRAQRIPNARLIEI